MTGDSGSLRRGGSSGRGDLDRYARSDLARSLRGLATSVVPFIGLWGLMYLALPVSYWLVLVLAVPAAGFLLRTYILFHDCVHGSFLSKRRANAWVGTVLALIVFTPFARWRQEHVMHHATAGDLDRRGVGDVPVLTVAEYNARSWWARLGYRLFRSPFVMFGLGPIYSTLVMQRLIPRSARFRMQRSVWGTNLTIALGVAALCWLLGWRELLLVEAPIVLLTGGVGIWLFYVQHQFPDSYWDRSDRWSFSDAALRGSSYLRLPRVLQFFTGNIGFHHVHHLNPKIPNYNLQRAHDEQPIFRSVPTVSLWQGLRAVRLKLWDEETARLVTWRQCRLRGSGSTA
jgi:omega-6 fatty acid desaturase (delta-12 desaturase)